MIRALIAIAALSLGLALPATTGAKKSPKTLVRASVTGGIAGINTTTVIRKDGTGTLTERDGAKQRLRVPADEMKALRKRLKEAHFESLGNYPVPPGSADFFETHVTYAGKTVDASYRIPKRLTRVLQAIDAAVNAGLANAR